MPKATKICCIPGCDNTPESTQNFPVPIKFYKFPNHGPFTAWRKEKRQQWIDAVGIKNQDGSRWEPTKSTFICSEHFVGGEKSENPLGPSYIPTLFPISYGTLNISKPSKRSPAKISTNTESELSSKIIKMPSNSGTNYSGEASRASDPEIYSTLDIVKTEICPLFLGLKEEFLDTDYNVSREDFSCQVDLPNDKQNLGGNYFICNMCVENDVCTAEVQVNIVSTVHKAVGCDSLINLMNRRDVACGPSVYEQRDLQAKGFRGIKSIRNDAELTEFCGVTFATFDLLLSLLPDISGKKLSAKNKLMIFLMKLKLGLSYTALAVFFNVHRSTALKTFLEILQCLPILLEEYIYWPTKDMIKNNLPQVFKKKYPNCRVIVDFIEMRVEIPSIAEQRESLYSTRQETFTKKFLLACTPNGFVCFKSKCYGGGTSDEVIANDTEFLDFIESGDVVLADERFPDIKKSIEKKEATFFRQVEDIRKISTMRNHIKRCMERIRTFQALSFLPTDMLPYADSIIHVCCSLVNLQLPMS